MEADRTEKFSPIARVMNRTMTAALQIPHFGYKDEVDMSALVKLRKQLKHQVGRHYIYSRCRWISVMLNSKQFESSVGLSYATLKNSRLLEIVQGLQTVRFGPVTRSKNWDLSKIWNQSQDRSAKLIPYLAISQYILIQYVSFCSFSRRV